MNRPIVINVTDKSQNIVVAKDGEHIIELAFDLDHMKGSAQLCHSVFIVPAHLILARNHMSNVNRYFYRIARIWRHIDCQIIIIADEHDIIDKRPLSLCDVLRMVESEQRQEVLDAK